MPKFNSPVLATTKRECVLLSLQVSLFSFYREALKSKFRLNACSYSVPFLALSTSVKHKVEMRMSMRRTWDPSEANFGKANHGRWQLKVQGFQRATNHEWTPKCSR